MRRTDASQVDRDQVRELPKNIEAEQVVLGSAILEPEGTIPILVESSFRSTSTSGAIE